MNVERQPSSRLGKNETYRGAPRNTEATKLTPGFPGRPVRNLYTHPRELSETTPNRSGIRGNEENTLAGARSTIGNDGYTTHLAPTVFLTSFHGLLRSVTGLPRGLQQGPTGWRTARAYSFSYIHRLCLATLEPYLRTYTPHTPRYMYLSLASAVPEDSFYSRRPTENYSQLPWNVDH